MAQEFKLIAITPPGLPEPSIAISASANDDGLGVLDLEYIHDKRAAFVLDALADLARYARNGYGIKLSSHSLVAQEVSELISDLPQKPVFILTSGDGDINVLGDQVKALHNQGIKVLWEAICLAEARFGERIGADGIIAKGHESAGRIGEETTLVLLQLILKHLALPIYAHGGIGLHTASACYAAGAAGILLDSQLLLTRESPLSEKLRDRVAIMDGSETSRMGYSLGEAYRVYSRPNIPVIEELRRIEAGLLAERRSEAETLGEWRKAILARVGWDSPEENLLLLGQDSAFAAPLAEKFVTVGGILEGIKQAICSNVQIARDLRPFNENSPFALSLGVRYPIFQGPMARISDTPAFAVKVAEAGGLPFIAISLMPVDELRGLLEEAQNLLGSRPWGVGIIGFLPPDLFSAQLKVIREYRPPFALIAGGRPGQNQLLEDAGIATYMHVPSPGLLKIHLQNGARRFILEGRESGGHVGPRTSFVLWEEMIDEMLKYLSRSKGQENLSSVPHASEYHILFAGGIHDALSASMVAVMAAPLAQLGVQIGVQMGTAYLFTEELVQTGGITDTYQKEAVKCDGTVILEVGPGHANRCMYTPFTESFEKEKQKLLGELKSPEEIRFAMEQISIGKLHAAAKGTALVNTEGEPKIVRLDPEEQLERGIYMIGQVGAIKDQIYNIETLHRDVSAGSTKLLEDMEPLCTGVLGAKNDVRQDIAIIGMASVLPKAQNVQAYWENILNKVNTVTVIPKERWNWELYYNPDPKAKDKVYSKWGCFLDDVLFDPVKYGIPPNSIPSIEPLQLITLEMVSEAIKDAGYDKRPFLRERTSVIIGASGGSGDLGLGYSIRSALPSLVGESSAEMLPYFDGFLPEWTEDSFPGILMNVTAGRIANRFDLGGENYTVDAACASSLAAVHLAVKELNTHNSDMVITGGTDMMMSAFVYLCFSKTMALSPTGDCRPLDEGTDGIVLGEGAGILVLKRLEDAERDGDKIYAVIKAIGSSSDGRYRSLVAPRIEGQALALRRAYQKAKVSPSTVELIEAHGTGTVLGDRTEIQALSQVFNGSGASRQYCAIGSVKSMIGHTKGTAGLASLIKTALALHHKVLPPTIGVENPNISANFPESPFYINTETRPWIDSGNEHPRRAGVSAFGFGGTNFHAVLEEYTGYEQKKHTFPIQEWQSELFIWKGSSRQEIAEEIKKLENSLSQKKPKLRDLSFNLWESLNKLDDFAVNEDNKQKKEYSLAIIAASIDDLWQKVVWAQERLAEDTAPVLLNDPRGIYYTEQPLAQNNGRISFLFPGQGSQYINMLIELTVQFPEIRSYFEKANRILKEKFTEPLSRYIFPQPSFTEEEKQAREQALAKTNVAQPAIAVASIAMLHLLEDFGVRPDFLAGHSFGEYVALSAAGVFAEDALIALSEARGRFIVESAGEYPGTMAAVNADVSTVSEVISQIGGVYIANKNSPRQTVITGAEESVKRVIEKLEAQEVRARIIPVACAFHSPIVASARKRLAEFLFDIKLSKPRIGVFSNTTASLYPEEPEAIVDLLSDHLVNPVEFTREILAMYEAGARIFVEVGPRSVLTKLVDEILSGNQHLAVASDQHTRNGLTQLQHLLGQLAAHGVPVKLDRFYQGREVKLLDETDEPSISPTAWVLNGYRAKPISKADKPDEIFPQINLKDLKKDTETEKDGNAREKRVPFPKQERFTNKAIPPSARKDEVTQIMTQYQQLMNRFLDTQKSVMLAYLQSRGESQKIEAVLQPGFGVFGESSTKEDWVSGESSPKADLGVLGESSSKMVFASDPVETGTAKRGAEIPTREDLTGHLLKIISERTGYPVEMIGLDLDMEADLGIDSIKRIEILASLQGLYNFEAQDDDLQNNDAIMELAGLRTAREVIGWIENRINAIEAQQVKKPDFRFDTVIPMPQEVGGTKLIDDNDTVGRYTLTLKEKTLDESRKIALTDRVLVITDDETGVAISLAESLKTAGHTCALVKMGAKAQQIDNGFYTADLTKQESVSELLKIVRGLQGAIGGLIHLVPLKPLGEDSFKKSFHEMSLADWKERLSLEVKSLFYFAKELGGELKEAASYGDACFISATRMGGILASDDSISEADSFFPGHGGVAGFLKSIAHEWSDIRVKAIDFSADGSVSAFVHQLMQEITSNDGLVEIGYTNGSRCVLDLKSDALDKTGPAVLQIDPSWVILVTGGARGITSDVAQLLAQRYKPTLLLAGRTAPPEPEESPETAGLRTPQELKAAIMGSIQKASQTGKDSSNTPSFIIAQVEAVYSKLMKDREIRESIAKIQDAGAKVHYYQVDVSDEEMLGEFIDEIYHSYGRLDGVIHGAGIIEDKLIADKTPESFDRVFDTKTDSVFILSRKLRVDKLSFFVIFSSVAGLFGNRGQSDYAAANGIYNKLAIYLNRIWHGRVVSVIWGPWESGMVTPELAKRFSQAGIDMVPRSIGPCKLDDELCYGSKNHAEVVLGGRGWADLNIEDQALGKLEALKKIETSPIKSLDGNRLRRNESSKSKHLLRFPLIGNGDSFFREADGTVQLTRQLNLARDIYLNDHKLDGKPVFPIAMAMELMGEAASLGWEHLQITEISDLQVLQGIVLEDGKLDIRVIARPLSADSSESVQLEMNIISAKEPQRMHYSARVELQREIPKPVSQMSIYLEEEHPFPMEVHEAYRQWLFHGPIFQGITEIQGIGTNGIIAKLSPSFPENCLAGDLEQLATSEWIVDPVIVDSGLQLIILWARNNLDMTPLPSRIIRYRRFGAISGADAPNTSKTTSGQKIECQLHIQTGSSSNILSSKLVFFGEDGRLIYLIEGAEAICSKALNRLSIKNPAAFV